LVWCLICLESTLRHGVLGDVVFAASFNLVWDQAIVSRAGVAS
jgi:hypothetical protein